MGKSSIFSHLYSPTGSGSNRIPLGNQQFWRWGEEGFQRHLLILSSGSSKTQQFPSTLPTPFLSSSLASFGDLWDMQKDAFCNWYTPMEKKYTIPLKWAHIYYEFSQLGKVSFWSSARPYLCLKKFETRILREPGMRGASLIESKGY